MTTFRSVNTSLGPDMYGRNGEDTTPTTPRPSTAPSVQPQIPNRMDDATTPTRANFAASALAKQRPLPAEPFPAAVTMPETNPDQNVLHRGNSQYSATSRDSDDVDMNGSEEGDEGSDDESVNADGTRTKKKKSQRFYCTDYPPCHLSFTRSEHLARHIRKHTGERPFQCHCSRRFSRLDNLRQHAQTVHVNEEIPQDSLAATGTRFQRQVRTERVRPPGNNRSRASTAGSQTQARGHNRNSLSASSIVSSGSYTSRDDVRRRPPPLEMATGSRLSGEFGQQAGGLYNYRPHSPGGYGTPTSATFSTGQNSPRWGSAIQSPIVSHSRTQSIYEGHRTPGRRLSVPSAGNPFQSPHGASYGPPGMAAFSPTPSQLTSPTTSTSGSTFSRRESMTNPADDAWRRRTWHPDTNSNFASRLQYVTTPNYYSTGPPVQPPVVPSNAPPLGQSNSMRLPGIESFDPLPRPATPVRRHPSPMMIDTPSRASEQYREERPSSQHWGEVNRGLNQLDLSQNNTPQKETASSWASDAHRAVQAQAEQTRVQPPPQTVRFEESPYSARSQQNFHHHQSAPPVTPKEQKRHGWYNGPANPSAVQHPPLDPRLQRTSPADSSSSEGVPGTPSSATVGDFNPGIMHSNGYVENRNGIALVPEHRILPSNVPNGYPAYTQSSNGEATYAYSHQQPPQTPQHRVPKADSNMSPLDTLVAAATSQGHNMAF